MEYVVNLPIKQIEFILQFYKNLVKAQGEMVEGAYREYATEAMSRSKRGVSQFQQLIHHLSIRDTDDCSKLMKVKAQGEMAEGAYRLYATEAISRSNAEFRNFQLSPFAFFVWNA